jgi:hypothetical protein
MSKTLSESAAEILRASMNAGKEPMQSLNATVNDLGGATPDDDYSGGPGHGEKDMDASVGVAAAKAVKQAAKPGESGVPAEPMKKLADVGKAAVVADGEEEAKKSAPVAEETVSEEDAEIVEEGGTQSPEETKAKKLLKPGQKIGAMALGEAEEDKDEDEEDEEEKDDDEEEKQANEAWKKNMVAKHKGSMKEDVDALFNGESLSEDFRMKATTIFEAAVQSRVENIVEDVFAENEVVLAEAFEALKEEMSQQVDEYLNYVVEQWMEENAVAIETGLRAELVDDFISGLKNLFAEHYVEIPEEKVDVAETLAVRVSELEEAIASIASEADEKIASLSEELNIAKKNEAIRKVCEGLTETQIAKMKSLAEGVEFTTEGEFGNKLAVIRENYFPSKSTVKSEVKALQETTVSEEPEVAEVHGIMAHYVKAISKTAPKA